jgi:hypothetical protein
MVSHGERIGGTTSVSSLGRDSARPSIRK